MNFILINVYIYIRYKVFKVNPKFVGNGYSRKKVVPFSIYDYLCACNK